MARSYSDMVDLIEQKLQDTTNATFTAAKINYQVEESLKELSKSFPHVIAIAFEIESRFGTASSTSANNLVDTGKSQFLSTDPTNEKVVWNDTDKTWATITSYSSATQVGLSANIMASGEKYYIFNKRCRNSRQLFIGDMLEYSSVIRGEYPTNYWPRRWRTVRLLEGHDVVEILLDFTPDDSDPALTSSRTEVLLEFAKTHILSQLTDLAGEVDLVAGYAAGDTSMVIDGLQASGTIEEGEEFTLENHRTLYIATADATITTNEATVTFFPGLEAAATDNDDVAFVKSSLMPNQEEILADLVVARLMNDEAIGLINTIPKGGPNTWQDYVSLARANLAEIRNRIRMGSPPKIKHTYSRL